MPNKTLRDLREEMTDEQVKNVLAQFNVEPRQENENFIVFPTCCHNLEGGSPKLYYYKNTHLFRCYTECDELFDIFHLLVKMEHLRNKEITLHDAVVLCDCDTSTPVDYYSSEIEDFKYMQELMQVVSVDKLPPLKTYDPALLNRYTWDLDSLQPWINEGISIEQLQLFNIKYDPIENCIVIPNYDINGKLIGVRGRFMDPNAPAKYAPLWYNNVCLSHPTGRSLYGIYQNQEAIRKKRTVMIFEGEKSVMKYGTYYKDNIALATLGKNITASHIHLMLSLGVTRVILGYDADYETTEEMLAKREEYRKLAKILTPYFATSVLIDFDLGMKYKDSPIDEGKDYFEKLLSQREDM
jgi:hypothetical protein